MFCFDGYKLGFVVAFLLMSTLVRFTAAAAAAAAAI